MDALASIWDQLLCIFLPLAGGWEPRRERRPTKCLPQLRTHRMLIFFLPIGRGAMPLFHTSEPKAEVSK